MDWVLTLSMATFAVVIAFLAWNYLSTKRHRETRGNTGGIGGPNDPLSGTTTEHIRPAEAMRTSLDAAADAPTPGKGLLD